MAAVNTTPLWRDRRVLRILLQAIVLILLGLLFWGLGHNLVVNYQRLRLPFGFDFVGRSASFGIGDTSIAYRPSDSFGRAILVGLLNSLRVIVFGTLLATIAGITIGMARLSNNGLVRQLAWVYVEIFRNTPLLLQLFFWYTAVYLKLPRLEEQLILPGSIFLSIQGAVIPWPQGSLQTGIALLVLMVSGITGTLLWRYRHGVMIQRGESAQGLQWAIGGTIGIFVLTLVVGLDWSIPQLNATKTLVVGGVKLSPEFAAILTGLTLYTAAFIAEAVRAGIQSVPKGQWEAARALGLRPPQVMRWVIFPQALRVMVPPLTSEYLNLAKNSSLATAIAYPDVYSIASTISSQTGRSVEMLLVVMGTYLVINLIISSGMNLLNRSVQLKER